MKAKITELEVKGYGFSGIVELNEESFEVTGEFLVRWDGQYPIIEVTQADLVLSFRDIELDDNLDLEDLEQQILETDDGSWYADRESDLIDRAHSMWEDR